MTRKRQAWPAAAELGACFTRILARKLKPKQAEPLYPRRRCLPTDANRRGKSMARPQIHPPTEATAFVPERRRTRYLVVRQEDVWFIKFDGEEYGPYKSEREAMLFAIDAAHKLGEQGEETEVLKLDENGEPQPAWRHGHDSYPPRE